MSDCSYSIAMLPRLLSALWSSLTMRAASWRCARPVAPICPANKWFSARICSIRAARERSIPSAEGLNEGPGVTKSGSGRSAPELPPAFVPQNNRLARTGGSSPPGRRGALLSAPGNVQGMRKAQRWTVSPRPGTTAYGHRAQPASRPRVPSLSRR